MPVERQYEIPFEHLSPELKEPINAIRGARVHRAITLAATGGIAVVSPTSLFQKPLTTAAVFVPSVITLATNRLYKNLLRQIGETLRGDTKFVSPAFFDQHLPEEQLRVQFTHLFVKRNGNLVLTNPHSAKELIRGLKRTRIRFA
ncbi:MAG: hypothetical protein AB1626_04105 [Candidatus Micrarchaeota archaeon]